MARAVNVTGPLAHHAEGPVWSKECAVCAGST
jgi:hypothetical protein